MSRILKTSIMSIVAFSAISCQKPVTRETIACQAKTSVVNKYKGIKPDSIDVFYKSSEYSNLHSNTKKKTGKNVIRPCIEF